MEAKLASHFQKLHFLQNLVQADEKHYCNTEKIIKHLGEIVIPYINKERKK